MKLMEMYDVVIVGGSYAGLSAALLLGRSMRRVLVIDNQQPANRQTPHSHSFLTQDGAAPAQLAAVAREQVARYPTVAFQTDTVVAARTEAVGFEVQMAGGANVKTRKLLLATGVVDELLPIPGLAECWGISVLHCPYCHGYEVRGQQLGLLANGDVAAELVALIRNWSRQLTVFTNGPAIFTPEQQALLKAHEVPVVETPVVSVAHAAGYLTALRTADEQLHPLDAVFARFSTRLPGTLAQQLGCTLTATGHIQVTEFGETGVTNLYAAGDATTPMRQVAAAVAQGAKAGAWLNRELIGEGIYAEV
ncbi:NAD(P)/FAD-dependent oxidoreductase [Hymenobacter puniceus]|uniref:NAD(P)/FAD-dependent oxidoreductase n=1 Tax=Hymenobacter sp. BT190 TaxID=2763505 RepID=UPI0021C58B60|nr:NAD(P)/FAD-dependent oxidoreductase [Hymenobacter sp. BT190]